MAQYQPKVVGCDGWRKSIQTESILLFLFALLFLSKKQSIFSPINSSPSPFSLLRALSQPKMPPKRAALEIRSDDHSSQKWQLSLAEAVFLSFLSHGGEPAKTAVFGEGSLFSPFLFGKFFDPADAFPLWDFDSDALLSGLRSGKKTSVYWTETESEYIIKADLPGGKKCEVEITGDESKVLEISGRWRGTPSSEKDWRAGRWWEHGFVRRIELPDDANWKKAEAYIYDDNFLEVKIQKNISAECSLGPREPDSYE